MKLNWVDLSSADLDWVASSPQICRCKFCRQRSKSCWLKPLCCFGKSDACCSNPKLGGIRGLCGWNPRLLLVPSQQSLVSKSSKYELENRVPHANGHSGGLPVYPPWYLHNLKIPILLLESSSYHQYIPIFADISPCWRRKFPKEIWPSFLKWGYFMGTPFFSHPIHPITWGWSHGNQPTISPCRCGARRYSRRWSTPPLRNSASLPGSSGSETLAAWAWPKTRKTTNTAPGFSISWNTAWLIAFLRLWGIS